MRTKLFSIAFAATVLMPGVVSAQTAPAAAPASPHTITGNLGLFSSYRFRGIDQTFGDPALQGGVDYSHSSGFYLGNWNSNVQTGAGYPGASLEMDFYGGWKKTWGDWGLDAGFIYYYYPGSDAGPTIQFSPAHNRTGVVHTGRVDNKEIYLGGIWKFVTLKYYHSIDDYFSTPGTKNSYYLDLGASYDLGNGWGINGHVGHMKFKSVANGDYTDWKVGVTKDVAGWVFGAAYVDTNADGDCAQAATSPQPYCFPNSTATKFKDAGRSTFVVSVTKTF